MVHGRLQLPLEQLVGVREPLPGLPEAVGSTGGDCLATYISHFHSANNLAMRRGQGVVELLYSYLASAGISSSESLLSALKTADTGFGRDTGGNGGGLGAGGVQRYFNSKTFSRWL